MNKNRVQIVEIPTISQPIRRYDNFQNTNINNIKKEKKISVINKGVLYKSFVCISIILCFSIVKMFMIYNTSDLINKKLMLENNLLELKKEVDTLENTYISNFDLKQIEEHSKELGFVNNDSVKYIKISN